MVISMKNIFGVNTTDKSNIVYIDGKCFITRSVSPSLLEHLSRASENNEKLEKKAGLPAALNLVKSLSFILAIIFTIGILKADVPFDQAFENAPVILIGAPVLFLVSVILKIYEYFRIKKVGESQELTDHMNNLDELFSLAKNELGIPDNTVDIDVLFSRYIIKNNTIKSKPFGLCSHRNEQYMMYVEKNTLYIANMYDVMEIPLSSLGDATLSDKLRDRASFSQWNKSEAYNSEKYKKYKITLNNQGSYFCGFYTVEIHDTKGDFCLLIPSYDFEAFSTLTGVHVAEN